MKIRIYKDRSGEWRWRMVARNGRVVADSAEGYKTKRGAVRAVWNVVDSLVWGASVGGLTCSELS